MISFMTGVMNFEGDSKIMYYWLSGKSESSFFKKVFQKQFFKQEKFIIFPQKLNFLVQLEVRFSIHVYFTNQDKIKLAKDLAARYHNGIQVFYYIRLRI